MDASLSDLIRSHARRTVLPWGETGDVLSLDAVSRLALAHDIPAWEVEALALSLNIRPERYLRNGQSIPIKGQIRLLEASLGLVGLGGLGGTLLEQLLRLGIGRIRAADGDSFEESNLNRQALSDVTTMGESKARAAGRRGSEINPSVSLETVSDFLTPESLPGFLKGCDLAVDALGGLGFRPDLQRAAADADIPLVTGALAGWTGYVGVVMPGQTGPADVMGRDNGAEENLGCPAPAVTFFASLMAAEAVKVLTGETSLAGRMLVADLRTLTFETVTL